MSKELTKIAREIRIIKSELDKLSGIDLGDYPGSATDKVDGELYDNANRKVVKKYSKISLKTLLALDILLSKAYEAHEDGLFSAIIDCEEYGNDPYLWPKRSDECEEAERLKKKYKKLLKILEKEGLLKHYLNGGSAMVEITFEDYANKDVYRILEGDIEIY